MKHLGTLGVIRWCEVRGMAKKKSNRPKGVETTAINPGWIKKRVPASYADDDLHRIVMFYVINTPCTALSSSGIDLKEYGWNKDIWKKSGLKKLLFNVANLKSGETFVPVSQTNAMKYACESAKMKKGFHSDRSRERIALYRPSGYNDFMSVLYHIRNAFAHGRLAMYEGNDGIIFVLEDGKKRNDKFYVRSRMILKKSTLLTWIDILECKTEEAKQLQES